MRRVYDEQSYPVDLGNDMPKIYVWIDVRAEEGSLRFGQDIHNALSQLAHSSAVPTGGIKAVLEHLITSVFTGVNHSGSWERRWLEQAFGDWPVDTTGTGTRS